MRYRNTMPSHLQASLYGLKAQGSDLHILSLVDDLYIPIAACEYSTDCHHALSSHQAGSAAKSHWFITHG